MKCRMAARSYSIRLTRSRPGENSLGCAEASSRPARPSSAAASVVSFSRSSMSAASIELPRALRKLDHYAVLLLDDVGYIQQSPDEAEILFTLLAERYERRSVVITSNLIFAQWDRIFRDQMATAAAIDRLVHHSVLLEFDVSSFRTEHAKRKGKATPSRPEAAS